MAARRTNKTHVIRQTTGEKYPTQVVDPGFDRTDADDDPSEAGAAVTEETPADEQAAVAQPENASMADETAPTEDFDDESIAEDEDTGSNEHPNGTESQENLFDLFSQEVTGSTSTGPDHAKEVAMEEPLVPEPTDDTATAAEEGHVAEPADEILDKEMGFEEEPSTEEVSPEEGETLFEDDEEPPEEAEMPYADSPEEPTDAYIDEAFIEEGAPNGSIPFLSSQMLETELGTGEEPSSRGDVFAAEGSVLMRVETQNAVLKSIGSREDVLAYARVAGITAGKHTGEFIPSCPAQAVSECAVDIYPIAASGANVLRGWKPARKDGRPGFHVQASCAAAGSDEVQTQALAAVSAACITIFDMMSGQDATMDITDVRPLREEEPAAHTAAEEAPEGKPAEKEETEEERLVPTSPLPGGAGTGQPAPAIAFIGFQNSGKTTLVERVISNLTKRGLRIGSIKLHGPKGFEIDQPGRDSWRHAQAGSRHVGLISPDQYAEYASTSSEVPVQDLLTHYTDVDLVIVEGLKTSGIPSIVVARSGVDRIRGISSYDLIDDDTLAIACNEVTARGIRAQWDKMRTGDDEMGNPDLPEEPPAFLDINDVPEIVSFVMDYLKAE